MKRQLPDHTPRVDKESINPAHRAVQIPPSGNELLNFTCAVIQADLDFMITGWNETAEEVYGLDKAMRKSFFEVLEPVLSKKPADAIKEYMQQFSTWHGTIRPKDDAITPAFPSSIHYLVNDKAEAVSIIMISYVNCLQPETEQKLSERQIVYGTLIDTLWEGIMMIGATGMITAINKRAAAILGVTEAQVLGQLPISYGWTITRPDGSILPDSETPAVVSLQTGFPQKNISMRIERRDGTFVWITVSTYALVKEGEFNPYAVVVSFSDITKDRT